ncbi:MAG: hypothetical protein ABEJ86_05155 [Halococcoides sp.]
MTDRVQILASLAVACGGTLVALSPLPSILAGDPGLAFGLAAVAIGAAGTVTAGASAAAAAGWTARVDDLGARRAALSFVIAATVLQIPQWSTLTPFALVVAIGAAIAAGVGLRQIGASTPD